ncbi:MAG: FAD-binding domain-containing protein [Chitinophagales bacterium]|nr:FAD-binding domain-containing protein [Chitinophagales bacterium]
MATETTADFFPLEYSKVLERLENLDVKRYAFSRNYLNGTVSRLSPYISRGLISLPFVLKKILSRYTVAEAYKFIFELAWREYFYRVWEQHGDKIFSDLKHPQQNVRHYKIPKNVLEARTGIHVIDQAISNLYSSGYMHNHARMYVASITCNIAGAHWFVPSKWMYYHLLDGDLASNTLSWQWVAGSFSSKKYYCNQENINKYSGLTQTGTFLDTTYENLMSRSTPPEQLKETCDFNPPLELPLSDSVYIVFGKPILLYNHYTLDPNWRNYMDANRILLLDTEHFSRFPVSQKVIDFIVNLAKTNIKDIQVFKGTFADLKSKAGEEKIFFRKHPAFLHWKGESDEPEYMFPDVKTARGSFMNYWKECLRHL